MVETNAQAAHELLDRVETETACIPSGEIKDDSKEAENAYLKRKLGKLEKELKRTLVDTETRLLKEQEILNQVLLQ